MEYIQEQKEALGGKTGVLDEMEKEDRAVREAEEAAVIAAAEDEKSDKAEGVEGLGDGGHPYMAPQDRKPEHFEAEVKQAQEMQTLNKLKEKREKSIGALGNLK